MIVEMSAKMNGLNPEAYLRDTLTKIAEDHPFRNSQSTMSRRSVIGQAGRVIHCSFFDPE